MGLKILAGDFGTDRVASVGLRSGQLDTIYIARGGMLDGCREVSARELSSVEVVTEENKAAIGKAFGGGVLGLLLGGPIGALAGALLGGRTKAVTLMVQLHDGRRFLCVASPSDHLQLMSAVMTNEQGPSALERLENAADNEALSFLSGIDGQSKLTTVVCPHCRQECSVDPSAGQQFECATCRGQFRLT